MALMLSILIAISINAAKPVVPEDVLTKEEIEEINKKKDFFFTVG